MLGGAYRVRPFARLHTLVRRFCLSSPNANFWEGDSGRRSLLPVRNVNVFLINTGKRGRNTDTESCKVPTGCASRTCALRAHQCVRPSSMHGAVHVRHDTSRVAMVEIEVPTRCHAPGIRTLRKVMCTSDRHDTEERLQDLAESNDCGRRRCSRSGRRRGGESVPRVCRGA
jgi:hypothetical protein